MKQVLLSTALVLLSLSAQAALNSAACVDSDLAFLEEIAARAHANDESLFDDERSWASAALLLREIEVDLHNGWGHEPTLLAHYQKISNYPSCEALREDNPKFQSDWPQRDLPVKSMIFISRSSRGINFDEGEPLPIRIPYSEPVSKNSAEAKKRKAFKELRNRAEKQKALILWRFRGGKEPR